jgi:hypothetical protein
MKREIKENLLVFSVKLFGNVGFPVHGDGLKKSLVTETNRRGKLTESDSEREEEEDRRSKWSFRVFSSLSLYMELTKLFVSLKVERGVLLLNGNKIVIRKFIYALTL